MRRNRLRDRNRDTNRRIATVFIGWIVAWMAVGVAVELLGLLGGVGEGGAFALGAIIGSYVTLMIRPFIKDWIEAEARK